MHQIKHIKHNEIDFKKWDQVVLSSQLPLVFAQSFYLNATSPDWDALVMGDYESIFPLTEKTKFGITYLPQPPFTSQLGVYGKVNVDIERLFYDFIYSRYKLIEIELNAANQLKTDRISLKNTYVIDYKNNYEFNQNTKRNIAKANGSHFVVERVAESEIIPLSKKLLNPFLKNDLGLSSETINVFDQLLSNAMQEGYLYTFKVMDTGNVIKAIGHFICNGKHALYLKGTNFDKADNSGSMHLLMSYAIEFFAGKATQFDFGGGSNSQGLANFYKGLGGINFPYGFLSVNNLPWYIKLLKNKK